MNLEIADKVGELLQKKKELMDTYESIKGANLVQIKAFTDIHTYPRFSAKASDEDDKDYKYVRWILDGISKEIKAIDQEIILL